MAKFAAVPITESVFVVFVCVITTGFNPIAVAESQISIVWICELIENVMVAENAFVVFIFVSHQVMNNTLDNTVKTVRPVNLSAKLIKNAFSAISTNQDLWTKRPVITAPLFQSEPLSLKYKKENSSASSLMTTTANFNSSINITKTRKPFM